MKSLKESILQFKESQTMSESLFDDDLEKNETGFYLYDYITTVSLNAEAYIEYFDYSRIQKDFNKITKKFPPKDWNSNPILSMKKIQTNPSAETLRQLLYIISSQLKITFLLKSNEDSILKEIQKILSAYMPANFAKEIEIYTRENYLDNKTNHIYVFFRLGPNKRINDPKRITSRIRITYETV